MNNFVPAIQDEVMDQFRQAFDMPLLRCHVLSDGRLMRFRLSSDKTAAILWLKAQHVIDVHGLPLTCDVKEWVVGNIVFDRWLEIQFDQTQLIPENY